MHDLVKERTDETKKIEDITIEIDKIMQSNITAIFSLNIEDSIVDGGSEYSQNSNENENKKLIAKKRKKGTKALKNNESIKDYA